MSRSSWIILFLVGCFEPDFGTKPCTDNAGCPRELGYTCVVGLCALTIEPSGTDPKSQRVEVDVRPPASFWVGTNATDGQNDSPSHIRSIHSAYTIDEREVTVGDYRVCVLAQSCTLPITGVLGVEGRICSYGRTGHDQHPVTCVTKQQAEAFCSWMGRRLPTETEWEFAALGTTGMSGQRLVFADPIGGNACWSQGDSCPTASYAKTYLGQRVSTEQPGFYDLLGNAWEWTTSPFCSYPNETCTTNQFVLRGASGFDNDPKLAKATSRMGDIASAAYPSLGFRCARSLAR